MVGPGLVLAGDAFGTGARIETAVISGLAAASTLLDTAARVNDQ